MILFASLLPTLISIFTFNFYLTIEALVICISISYSSDTNRAVVLTLSTNTATTGIPTVQVSVIDTVNGNQVGAHLTLESNYGTVELSADGTRALVSTSTQLAVINTMTGTLAGSTLNGSWGIDNALGSDGRRAVSRPHSDPCLQSWAGQIRFC